MSLIPKKGTVYVVDDDEGVRDSLQWLLEGKDYRVRCYDSAETFLSRYDPREVACLIVDIRMGGMTGLELQDRLLERKSPLPTIAESSSIKDILIMCWEYYAYVMRLH
jgi:FixJ family two-component response regulator